MRFLRSLLLLLITVILGLIAFNFAFSDVGRLAPDPVLTLIYRYIVPAEKLGEPLVWRATWGVVLALVVLYWLLGLAIWRSRPRPIQARTSDGETVLVHPGALLKFVTVQVESHPAVVHHKVRVRQRGTRGVSVWVMAQVRPIDSLPNIKHRLEESIRNGFANVVGIEKLDNLTIIVGLDEKSLAERPGPLGEPEAKPEPPVRGDLAAAAPAAAVPLASESGPVTPIETAELPAEEAGRPQVAEEEAEAFPYGNATRYNGPETDEEPPAEKNPYNDYEKQ